LREIALKPTQCIKAPETKSNAIPNAPKKNTSGGITRTFVFIDGETPNGKKFIELRPDAATG
jgi:hypothetical protein